MKKLMILAAVAAMAFVRSAFADTPDPANLKSYVFQLTVQGLPQSFEKLSDNAALYILDKSSSTVYAYATIDGFNNGTAGDDQKITYYGLPDAHGQSEVLLDGERFNNVYHSLSTGTTLKQQNQTSTSKDVVFTINFEADKGFFADHFVDVTGDNEFWKTSLIAVLSDRSSEYDPGYYQEFKITATGAKESNPTMVANAAYAVPEPTSAMLLLLGFAGLVLKRKQVA